MRRVQIYELTQGCGQPQLTGKPSPLECYCCKLEDGRQWRSLFSFFLLWSAFTFRSWSIACMQAAVMHVITLCVVLLDFWLPGKDDPWGLCERNTYILNPSLKPSTILHLLEWLAKGYYQVEEIRRHIKEVSEVPLKAQVSSFFVFHSILHTAVSVKQPWMIMNRQVWQMCTTTVLNGAILFKWAPSMPGVLLHFWRASGVDLNCAG